jgi:hypothetical protein
MTDPEHQPKLSAVRMFEAVIIAVIVAIAASLGSSFLTVTTLRAEMDGIKESVGELKSDLRQLRSDIYEPRWQKDRGVRASPDGVRIGRDPVAEFDN